VVNSTSSKRAIIIIIANVAVDRHVPELTPTFEGVRCVPEKCSRSNSGVCVCFQIACDGVVESTSVDNVSTTSRLGEWGDGMVMELEAKEED
jgi:hypothetical protein